MKLYSAVVKDGNVTRFIQRQEYENKTAFIHDLRKKMVIKLILRR